MCLLCYVVYVSPSNTLLSRLSENTQSSYIINPQTAVCLSVMMGLSVDNICILSIETPIISHIFLYIFFYIFGGYTLMKFYIIYRKIFLYLDVLW